MKRIIATLCLVMLMTLPAGFHGVRAQDGDFVIDPAAMALNSLDLRSNGFDGFGIESGRFLTGTDVSGWTASELGGEVSGLGGWGYLDGYTVTLGQRAAFGVPEVPSTAWVTSTVLRFDNDGGASAVFWELVKAAGTRDASQLIGPDQAGREFWVGSMDLTTDDRSAPQPGLVAIANTGLDIGIVFLVPGNDPSQIQPLSDRLSDKIAILRAKSGPDIGVRTVRVAGDGVSTANAIYFISYGAPTRLTSQTDADFAEVAEDYPGVVDGFRAVQTVARGDGTTWALQVTTLAFPDNGSANAWLQGAPDRLPGSQLVPDDATTGDASITLTATTSAGLAVRQVNVQAGSELAVIEIRGDTLVDPAALDALAAQQVTCFAQGCGALPVPVALRAHTVATPLPMATPPASIASPTISNATPEIANPEPEATATTEDILTDPMLGVHIAYDTTEWALANKDLARDPGGQSTYEFSNGVTSLVIFANGNPQGDLLACFDSARARVSATDGISNFAPGRTASGDPIFASAADAVQGVFTYTANDGGVMAVYIYCGAETSSPVTITAVATVPAAQFNDQSKIVAALLLQIGLDPR